MRRRHWSTLFGCAFAMALVSTPTANAEITGVVQPPTIEAGMLNIPGVGSFIDFTLDEFEVDESGKWKLKDVKGTQIDNNGTPMGQLTIEEIEFDPDPSIIVSFEYTNLSATPTTMSIAFTQPAFPFAAPNLILGSSTVQVIDTGLDGASLTAPAGSSIYAGQIDGATQLTLQDDGVFAGLSAPPGGTDSNSANSGFLPGATAVATDIGIVLNFTVSGNDRAQFLARFDVVVPEPSALAMLSLSGLALIRRRR